MTVEKTLERKLCKAITKMGGKAIKFYSLSFTGMPDRIILFPNHRIFFAEIKSTGKKLSVRQRFVINWLDRMDFFVGVIDSDEGLNIFLEMIK